jgi:sarcosine oxidase
MSETAQYDVIVVGLGAMGSAAAYQLARRGQRVLGLEQFERGHALGSSHGETRIIRMAYFEHPDYVPLLRRAYELWRETEAEAGVSLLHITGGIFIGPPANELVEGSLLSARAHGLAHTLLDAAAIRHRFPVFTPVDHEVGVYEDDAGVLFPERCIAAHLEVAERDGATLRHNEPMLRWSASPDGVVVESARASYRANRLVIAGGAWMGKLLDLPITAERIPLYWFEPVAHAEQFDLGRFPIVLWAEADTAMYLTPHVDLPGVKIGKHRSDALSDPDQLDRSVHPEDEQPLREFLARSLPSLNGRVANARVCMYENSPDRHFLIDKHPQFENVVFAAGFSGHGFKFASVVGEILADLATTGQATPDAHFLRLSRLAHVSGP